MKLIKVESSLEQDKSSSHNKKKMCPMAEGGEYLTPKALENRTAFT